MCGDFVDDGDETNAIFALAFPRCCPSLLFPLVAMGTFAREGWVMCIRRRRSSQNSSCPVRAKSKTGGNFAIGKDTSILIVQNGIYHNQGRYAMVTFRFVRLLIPFSFRSFSVFGAQ